MLRKIAFIYTESENQKDTFTPYHTRFDCAIKYGTNCKPYTFTYQCNTDHDIPTIASVMYSLIIDGEGYEESRNILEFGIYNGYDVDNDYEKVVQVYNECKRTYEALHEMFTDEELQEIMNEIE